VAIITAGTSDIPVARQAQIILEETGCRTHTFWDVGIAGLHRLLPVVEELARLDCDALVVVAGQEGGLAPVLAGLVDLPIIGVPTSTGSGFGGEGISALMTMLQSCSLGIAVVNIDNGIAAGAIASSIARRARRYASSSTPPASRT
jgi:NCAIR mutase (PurE)-related protein